MNDTKIKRVQNENIDMLEHIKCIIMYYKNL